MKCPTCESCEYEQYCGAAQIMRKCKRHNKKVKQTNEEWFCGLSTKEKAHELYRRCNYASIFGSPTAEEIEKWLKDVHKE